MIFIAMAVWVAILAFFVFALMDTVYDVSCAIRGYKVDGSVLFINFCTVFVTSFGAILSFSSVVVPFLEILNV